MIHEVSLHSKDIKKRHAMHIGKWNFVYKHFIFESLTVAIEAEHPTKVRKFKDFQRSV